MSEWEFVSPLESKQNYDAEVRSAAEKYGVDPDLAVAMHRREYDPKRWVSPKGARGPMQLMPGTAKDLQVDADDPIQNIEGGIRYFKQQLDNNGSNVPLALAAYNAGPGRVKEYGGIPPFKETREYIDNIISRYKKLKNSESGVAFAGKNENDEFEYVGPLQDTDEYTLVEPQNAGVVESQRQQEPVDYSGMQGASDISQIPSQSIAETVSPAVRAVAPTAGALGGAIAAAPSGPVGMVAGGALGYGAGQQLSNVIDEIAQKRQRPSPGVALAEAGKDLAVGAMQTAAGAGAGGAIPQIAGAGLAYGASRQAERAFNETTGKVQPSEGMDAIAGAAKDVAIGSALAAPFSIVPWAVAKHAEWKNLRAEQMLDSTIDKLSRKAFMSGVAGQRNATQITDYTDKMNFVVKDIAKNKDSLRLVDSNMNEVVGKLPNTRREMIQAVGEGKQRIFEDFDAMKQSAGGKGVLIYPDEIIRELTRFKRTKAVRLTNPEAIAFADEMIARFEKEGPMTPSDAQKTITAFNERLDKFYDKPSMSDFSKYTVEAIAVGKLRKDLDNAISSVEGPGYQKLKNAYGSYASVERDIARAAVTGSRAAPKGLVDFVDIATAHQAANALLSMSTSGIASTGVMAAAKHWIKNINNKDKMVSKMFSEVENVLTKQAGEKITAPFVPGGGKGPSASDIAQLDRELAEMSDSDRRDILYEAYKRYNLEQKLLPPGQGFRLIPGTGQKMLPAPETQERLLLPSGQGFRIIPESQRKSQTQLRDELYGIGSASRPPESSTELASGVSAIEQQDIPPEALRIMQLAREAMNRMKAKKIENNR